MIDNMAPEVLGHTSNREENEVTPKIDVWGAACFLYYLLAKVPLFGALAAWPEQPADDDDIVFGGGDENDDDEDDDDEDNEEEVESDLGEDDNEDVCTDVRDNGMIDLQAEQTTIEKIDLEDDLSSEYYEDSCSDDSDLVLMDTIGWQHCYWVSFLLTSIRLCVFHHLCITSSALPDRS